MLVVWIGHSSEVALQGPVNTGMDDYYLGLAPGVGKFILFPPRSTLPRHSVCG